MTPETFEKILAAATPGEWGWWSDDGSQLTLSGPDELENVVLSAACCHGCYQKAKDAGDPFRVKCLEPSTNDQMAIVTARNLAPLFARLWRAAIAAEPHRGCNDPDCCDEAVETDTTHNELRDALAELREVE